MREYDGTMTIGAFARATGVTVSALRFYDECGLVRPDAVDAATGYRYYSPGQITEVALIRHLRDIGLPLAEVRQVLAAPAHAAEDILAGHLRTMEQRLADARSVTRAALVLVRRRGRAVLPGRALATAIEQVSPAALADGDPYVLTGVLLESRDGELHLVATDRYRLSVRSLPLREQGTPFTAVVAAPVLREAGRWVAAQDEVGLALSEGRLAVEGPREQRVLPRIDEAFPDHRGILAGLPEPVSHVVVSRDGLLAALGNEPGARADLATGPGGLTVRTAGPGEDEATRCTDVAAEATGAPVAVSFAVDTLRPVVRAAVGPDVLLQIGAPGLPVVVRSADDGDLTSLAMPVRAPSRPVVEPVVEPNRGDDA